MPVNEHSILSDAQNDWPEEMLTNPNSNPLAGWAASVQGKIETLMLWLKQALELPQLLMQMHAWLTHEFGLQWWQRFEAWRTEGGTA